MTKILLVEDDKGLREIYGVRLLAEGYDIISAGDGEEALAMAIKDRPGLIISDVMMPKISGFDMLDILRSTTETRDIKVIMMTALSSEEQRQRGESLGADRYLVKSQVGIEDVVRTVHEILGDTPTATPQVSTSAQSPSFTSGPTPQSAFQQNPAPQSPVPSPAPAVTVPPRQPQAPAQQPAPVTAPFVPPAPVAGHRPQTLSDRVIQPLNDISSPSTSFADKMAEELAVTSAPLPAQPPITPTPNPLPQQPTPLAVPPPAPEPTTQPEPATAPAIANPVPLPPPPPMTATSFEETPIPQSPTQTPQS
jgi:CheY-like chemotaxis protein